LENQYINDIQLEHYIDNGCLCNICTKARKDIFIRAKKGEKKFNKIIHKNIINKNIIERFNKIKSISNNRFKIKF
jgi:hypothetical protein